jgi:small subunit ribosomal protein S6
MAEKKTKTNQYEGMFLFGSGAATEPQAAEATVRKFIEQHGGQIAVLKKWDERKLAYEVNGQKRGTYIIAFFTATGEAVGPIERDVKLNEQVLRVMITKADHMNQQEMEAVEPQRIEPREERNPWDRPSWNDRPQRDDRGPRGPRRDDAGGAPGAAAPAAAPAAAKE